MASWFNFLKAFHPCCLQQSGLSPLFSQLLSSRPPLAMFWPWAAHSPTVHTLRGEGSDTGGDGGKEKKHDYQSGWEGDPAVVISVVFHKRVLSFAISSDSEDKFFQFFLNFESVCRAACYFYVRGSGESDGNCDILHTSARWPISSVSVGTGTCCKNFSEIPCSPIQDKLANCNNSVPNKAQMPALILQNIPWYMQCLLNETYIAQC